MINALRQHWPEYLMEAAGLGLFMISAGVFGTLLEYTQSPVHKVIADPLIRRFLMGLAMGLTAVGIIYSPWVSSRERTSTQLSPSLSGGWARWPQPMHFFTSWRNSAAE